MSQGATALPLLFAPPRRRLLTINWRGGGVLLLRAVGRLDFRARADARSRWIALITLAPVDFSAIGLDRLLGFGRTEAIGEGSGVGRCGGFCRGGAPGHSALRNGDTRHHHECRGTR